MVTEMTKALTGALHPSPLPSHHTHSVGNIGGAAMKLWCIFIQITLSEANYARQCLASRHRHRHHPKTSPVRRRKTNLIAETILMIVQQCRNCPTAG
jgi:hypothetical protein